MFMASPLVFAWYLKFASEDIISPLLSCLTPSDCFPEDSSSPGRSLVEVKRERSANLDVNSCLSSISNPKAKGDIHPRDCPPSGVCRTKVVYSPCIALAMQNLTLV